MQKNKIHNTLQELYKKLISAGVSKSDAEKIQTQIEEKINSVKEPKIALIGLTGVGKSSTINALFNAGQEIGDVQACTQKEAKIIGSYKTYHGSKGKVIIYDMPGIGEDMFADIKHYQTYKKILPKVDVAVWLFHTGDRAMTPMQDAITKLEKEIGKDFIKKLVFAVNKADAIAPGELEWNPKLNLPSANQKINLDKFEIYIKSKIKQIIPYWNGEVVLYSARRHYKLNNLMYMMVAAAEKEKRWILNDLADVAKYIDCVDPEYREHVLEILEEEKKKSKKQEDGEPYE